MAPRVVLRDGIMQVDIESLTVEAQVLDPSLCEPLLITQPADLLLQQQWAWHHGLPCPLSSAGLYYENACPGSDWIQFLGVCSVFLSGCRPLLVIIAYPYCAGAACLVMSIWTCGLALLASDHELVQQILITKRRLKTEGGPKCHQRGD